MLTKPCLRKKYLSCLACNYTPSLQRCSKQSRDSLRSCISQRAALHRMCIPYAKARDKNMSMVKAERLLV